MNKRRSLLALDWLNFFMADVETGIGPFVSTYLSAAHHFDPAQIGIVLASQTFAQVIAQPVAGLLIDRVRRRRWLLAGSAVVISICAILIVATHTLAGQLINQIAIGVAVAFVAPTVNAISLGLVGRPLFSRRVGRNSAFSHAGNLSTALLAGLLGYAAGQQWIFYASAIMGAMVLGCIVLVRPSDIDEDAARGLSRDGEQAQTVYSPSDVLKKTGIALFALMIFVFHFANAAMLPLAGQELARTQHRAASLYMSACIVTAQTVMVPVAYTVGRVADRIGRKPLFLAAFAVLIARGVLFALHDRPFYIVGVEALDGVGTAIASVIAVLVVSDLAQGTGRFNFMQGLMQAAVGSGAFAGNFLAGMLAKATGFPTTFAVLASLAAAGLLLSAAKMPETNHNIPKKI